MRVFVCCFILTIACSTETIFEDPFANLPPNQLEVRDLEGVIKLWEIDSFKKYYIAVYVDGTIDSAVLGFVDDLNLEFQQEGLRVIFSGIYQKSDDNPSPWIGGQDIYSLQLSLIRIK